LGRVVARILKGVEKGGEGNEKMGVGRVSLQTGDFCGEGDCFSQRKK